VADLTAVHPLYTKYLTDWGLLNDCFEGERVIKAKRTTYLPATDGQLNRGGNPITGHLNPNTVGDRAYGSYKLRARFPELVSLAVEGFVGIMHRKPAVIELPPELEGMRYLATRDGESLQQLLRQINAQQFLMGRVGLLVDPDSTGSPRIAWYTAPSIRNWYVDRDGKPQLVVLDESGMVIQPDLSWDYETSYRVMILTEGGVYTTETFGDESSQVSLSAISRAPSINGREMGEIPFHFINSDSLVSDPTRPPLLGIAEMSLAIYRSEADYRHALYMTGQDTLVVKGELAKEEVEIGSASYIHISDEGDAKYVGVTGDGLSEQRAALESDRLNAANRVGTLLDNASHERESGEALNVRVAAKTASLGQIAKIGAQGLENALKQTALWVGADPDLVKVTPNTDFTMDGKVGQEILSLQQAVSDGFPLSPESLHAIAKKRELTAMTWEEEREKLVPRVLNEENAQQ